MTDKSLLPPDDPRPTAGIIVKGVGGLYTVSPYATENGTAADLLCTARGRFRLEGITPLPGDDVTVEPDDGGPVSRSDDPRYVITAIGERKSELIRPPLSNLSHLFLIVPCCRPAPDLLTADKLIAYLESKDIEPVVVVSKADLDRPAAQRLKKIYETAGYRVFVISSESGEGCDGLLGYMGEIASSALLSGSAVRAAFAGVSGAGKSTLLSRLFPALDLKTGSVSRKTERGRHTTRCAELYPVTVCESRFFLADTPGFSMLDFTRFDFLSVDDLPLCFREFSDCLGKCRYGGCTHVREEGCAVIEKMQNGLIAPSRHENFVLIREEILKKPAWKREKEEKQRAERNRK